MGRGCWDRHWIAPLAFIPFGLMLIVHRSLGLSDAMLAAPRPGQPFWPLYNVALVLALYLGVGGYLTHTFWLRGRGRGWVVVKCVALALAWAGMVVVLERSA